MKRTRRKMPSVIAIALVLSTLMVLASTAFAATKANIVNATPKGESIHEKIDISDITGEIAEPPELTSAASSIAREKEWYEYVFYSSEPVGYYYLNDHIRLSFYDPYDYASSLIMEVNDDITDWSSMNSLQISYTTGNSLSNSSGKSTNTETTTEKAKGKDESETNTNASVVTTTVEGRIDTYNYSKTGKEFTETDDETWTVSEQILGEIETTAEAGLKIAGVAVTTKGGINITNTNNFGLVKTETWKDECHVDDEGNSFSDYSHGYTEDSTTTTQKTDAGYSKTTTTIADRIATSTGSTLSSDITISTDNSTTITKTYDAAYFNASGSPLQWKIIHYKVMMPMKYQMEYLVDGEWIFCEYDYCLLTTIQGTCRSWLQNNVAYYEHWGTGEPVTWDEFWNQFFTKENLIQAYQNKLYPEN